jgi:Protein of unknown function (DUF642)
MQHLRASLTALLALAAAALTARCSAQNLVQNGSFEDAYSGWSFSGGLVKVDDPRVQCEDGTTTIGVNWESSLYQDIPTVAGQRYDFSFYMADWFTDAIHSNVVSLNVTFGSTSLGTVSFNGVGKGYQNMGWKQFDYIVMADSASSRITFFNPGVPYTDTRFPMIDNVSVSAIPEPTTVSLLLSAAAVLLFRCFRTNGMSQ